MSFPTPRQFGGKIIRTPDLLKCTVAAVLNKHLARQDARRRVVCIGARRKAGCILRNSHFALKPPTNPVTELISHDPCAGKRSKTHLRPLSPGDIRTFPPV